MRHCPPPSRRLFFAQWPGPDNVKALAQLANSVADAAQGKPTEPERLHLTLAFIGDVDEERVPDVLVAGSRVAAGRAPLSLELDRLGYFRHAGIAWAGCDATPEPLQALVEHLRRELEAASITFDSKPFRPHVSLARRCRRTPLRVAFAPVHWHADAFSVHASKLSTDGPAYIELARWVLGAAPAVRR